MKSKNHKLKAKIKLKQKQRFVEDIVKDEEIDMKELLNAKFKHPIRHWVKTKYTTIKSLVSLRVSDLMFDVKNLLGLNK
jgi:hypothetical protein